MLDYAGGWKRLHHTARRFFAPLAISTVPEDDEVCFIGVNDTSTTVAVALTVETMRPEGTIRLLATVDGSALTDAAFNLPEVDQLDVAKDEILLLSWQSEAGVGSGEFPPRPYKAYDPQPSVLRLETEKTGDAHMLALSADRLSLFARVEASVPGRISENAVCAPWPSDSADRHAEGGDR